MRRGRFVTPNKRTSLPRRPHQKVLAIFGRGLDWMLILSWLRPTTLEGVMATQP